MNDRRKIETPASILQCKFEVFVIQCLWRWVIWYDKLLRAHPQLHERKLDSCCCRRILHSEHETRQRRKESNAWDVNVGRIKISWAWPKGGGDPRPQWSQAIPDLVLAPWMRIEQEEAVIVSSFNHKHAIDCLGEIFIREFHGSQEEKKNQLPILKINSVKDFTLKLNRERH